MRHNARMAILLIFILGVVNFALNKAVLESHHPMIGHSPLFRGRMGRRAALATEFVILLIALLLAANGWTEIGWIYLAYSALNALAGWLIISGRV